MNYEDVYEQCKAIITDYLRVKDDEVHPDTNLLLDLNADSIALVELSFRISETFSIPVLEQDENLLVFKNLISTIHQRVGEK